MIKNLIAEKNALKNMVNKMIEKDNSNLDYVRKQRPPKNYMRPIKNNKKWSKVPHGPFTPVKTFGYSKSPVRKSPFDVDKKENKTEWDKKKPYLNQFKRLSTPSKR